MADILPPAPIESQFNSYQWSDWYRKVRDAINAGASVAWAQITGTPTTVAGYGISDAATLHNADRVEQGTDTVDDLIVDTSSKGLVLRDSAGPDHYWRITVNTSGVLVVTDLGTTKP